MYNSLLSRGTNHPGLSLLSEPKQTRLNESEFSSSRAAAIGSVSRLASGSASGGRFGLWFEFDELEVRSSGHQRIFTKREMKPRNISRHAGTHKKISHINIYSI